MVTLIIPCGGKSTRFKNTRPKYLLTYPDGEIMVKKAISGLDLNYFDRIIVTIVSDHVKEFQSDTILKQAFSIGSNSKVELCILTNFTRCQSETVYETIKKMSVDDSIVIKDSDNYFELKQFPMGNFISGIDIKTSDREINRLSAKSFLIVNEKGIITDIIEKEIKSEFICVGMYGFESSLDFCKAYESISKNSDWTKCSEIYISHVISYMIGTRKYVFMYAPVANYEDWGTMDDWHLIQLEKQTYFLDYDGVIVKNVGKYGISNWENSNEIIEENIKAIKEKYDRGAQIVVTTSRSNCYKEEIIKIFESRGIKLHAVITECNHSSRIIINDFAPSNPYPSCRAISIPRNGNLKDYLN